MSTTRSALRWLFLAALVSALGPVSVPGEAAPPPPPAREALVADGLAVYRTQYCGTCHTLDRAGTSGTFGPTHNGFAAIAAARIREEGYSGRATTAAEYARESIVEPGIYITPGYEQTRFHMPAYTQLSPDEIEALVAFLLAAD